MSENPNDKAGVGEGSEAKTEQAPSRRRLLKALAGAGGVFAAGAFLPQKWTSPIVSRVIVPAHAQATGVITGLFGGGGGSESSPGPVRAQGFGRRLLDTLIPAANAGEDPCSGSGRAYVNICLNVVGDRVDITVYPCTDFGGSSANGSGELAPDGSFGPVPVGWATATGTLSPAGGVVTLTAAEGYPGFGESSTLRTWELSVSSGSCPGEPGCSECYYD